MDLKNEVEMASSGQVAVFSSNTTFISVSACTGINRSNVVSRGKILVIKN